MIPVSCGGTSTNKTHSIGSRRHVISIDADYIQVGGSSDGIIAPSRDLLGKEIRLIGNTLNGSGIVMLMNRLMGTWDRGVLARWSLLDRAD